MKQRRAKTARTRKLKLKKADEGDDEGEKEEIGKCHVWTRDSVIDVKKMRQPETFAKLMEGKYTDSHVEDQREKDRLNFLNK